MTTHQVKGGVDAVVVEAMVELDDASTRYRAGDMTTAAFQAELQQIIKSVHVAAALAGYGGREAMTPARWGYVGSRIKTQYEYARGFIGDIISGDQSQAGINARADMYARAARATFEAVRQRERKESGLSQERNVLSARESCAGCISQTDLGWVPIGSLVPIGSRTCLSNCQCTYEFRQRAMA